MDGSAVTSREECLLCKARARTRPYAGALPWLVRCSGCGLAFADPQPTDDELSSIYDEHYYEQFGFVEGPHAAHEGLARTKQATYRRMLERAAPEIRSRGKRLLDVGCGLGFSLLAGKAKGFDATGLDPLALAEPDARPGRHILRGDLEHHRPEVPYDLLSMIDVIEHVRDPLHSLARARALLADGGVLLLATNDRSSPAARLMGSRWTHYHRAHLWFFDPATLRTLCERAGFEVVTAEGAHRVYNLEYIASILARGDNFPLAQHVAKGLLAVVPQRLQAMAWPPLPEGFLVIARKPLAR